MRIIIQADDYAISTAVSEGIMACARNNAMTQTGLFANMPNAEYDAKKLLKDCPNVALGQDINFCCGRPVTDPKLIPNLVQQDGSFLTSGMHRKKEMQLNADKFHPDMKWEEMFTLELDSHFTYEEIYLETENQVKRFIEITGQKPAYLGGHAYGNKISNKALEDVAKKYDVILMTDFMNKVWPDMTMDKMNPWYSGVTLENGMHDFGEKVQKETDLYKGLANKEWAFLEDEEFNKNDVIFFHTHAGFVDMDLCRRSSYTFIRIVEADFLMSEPWQNWMKEHDCKLVNVTDLKEEFGF